jgi:WD40 repeat protein
LLSSPDGQYLFGSDEFGTLTVWNLADGSQVRLNTVPAEEDFFSRPSLGMALSPDGQTLAFADQESIVLYSPANHQILAMIPTPENSSNASPERTPIAFSPDGSLLVVGVSDGSLYVLNAQTLEIIRRFQAHDNPGGLLALAFSPDGRLLATSSQDGTIRLWGIR